MPDAISTLSAQLARDPAGTSFLGLADALRRARRLDEAERIALRGLERHPYLPDAHDLLARIRGRPGRPGRGARTSGRWRCSWRRRTSARARASAFLAFRGGDAAGAERHLAEASGIAPDDPALADAIRAHAPEAPAGRQRRDGGRTVPRSSPASSRRARRLRSSWIATGWCSPPCRRDRGCPRRRR